MQVISINSTLTKLTTYPSNFRSSIKVKMFVTVGTSVSTVGVIALAIWFVLQMFLK